MCAKIEEHRKIRSKRERERWRNRGRVGGEGLDTEELLAGEERCISGRERKKWRGEFS